MEVNFENRRMVRRTDDQYLTATRPSEVDNRRDMPHSEGGIHAQASEQAAPISEFTAFFPPLVCNIEGFTRQDAEGCLGFSPRHERSDSEERRSGAAFDP